VQDWARWLDFAIYLLAVIGWVSVLAEVFYPPIHIQSAVWLLFFSTITLMLLNCFFVSKASLYLLSTFTSLITWRLVATAGYDPSTAVYAALVLLKIAIFALYAYQDISGHLAKQHGADEVRGYLFTWQLYFVRLLVGFIFVPHFCEKLFAGPVPRMHDVMSFMQLGVPHAEAFVFIAGLIELFGSLALSCGLLTRAASLGLVLYLLVASFLGHHFQIGFIWATPGGGWEYPFLWSVLIISFSLFGAGEFSLDYTLAKRFKLPSWTQWMMGGSLK
jgi:putative oxidoreductase